jgi:hypothetical protein
MEKPEDSRSDRAPGPDGADPQAAPAQRRREKPSTAPAAATASTGFPGSEVLSGSSARIVLARIVDGDPLGIVPRSADRIRERALILDGYRVALRAMARTARAALSYRGQPDLDTWLRSRIDESIEDTILEDREEERLALPTDGERSARYEFLSETLGVEPGLTRRMCVLFNDFPDHERRAFCAVIMEGKSINRYVAEGNGPPTKVREMLIDMLRRLSLPEDGLDPGDPAHEQ